MPYWSKAFDGLPECVSEVREYTRKLLGDCEGADAVELVVSELAGNAVRHSDSGAPGGQFTVCLAVFYDRWQVRVDDAGGPNVPHICAPVPIESVEGLDGLNDEVEVGRGLTLVAAMSSAWGVLGDQAGRAVWVEILIPKADQRDRCLAVPGGWPVVPGAVASLWQGTLMDSAGVRQVGRTPSRHRDAGRSRLQFVRSREAFGCSGAVTDEDWERR